MLFFSRSRADLGLTLVLAAATALLTLVLFNLDDDVQLLQYNRDMRPASCTVVSGELQSMAVPQGPPDVEGIPPEEKWRAEVIVAVTPDDARVEPFQAPAHDTLQGQFSTVKEFQEQWLDSHPVDSQDTCYYGVSRVCWSRERDGGGGRGREGGGEGSRVGISCERVKAPVCFAGVRLCSRAFPAGDMIEHAVQV